MSAPRVVAVAPGSPAAAVGLLVGDELVSFNGLVPRDVIEYQLFTDDADLQLEVERGGLRFDLDVPKAAGEPLGIEVHTALFDQVRTCDNHCSFCFIYQLPPGLRKSLYLKDDDYRLSFLYGNFTTLTRFTEIDLERIVSERLSPLYVSIHATDPEVRAQMLRNRRGAMSLRWLGVLLDSGIEVHGQIVVCPGLNDGAVLDDTLAGVLDRFPGLASLCVVPLGISRYSTEAELRPHAPAEAAAVIDCVEDWQDVFLAVLGRRLAFAADEYYLLAGRSFPAAGNYEGFPMHEDGIGMARTFEAEFLGMSAEPTRPASGFFSWVDGAPAEGYRAPRNQPGAVEVEISPRRGRSTKGILTGPYGARVLGPLVAAEFGESARVLEVPNDFFGGNIGVTGLMVGEDVAKVLAGQPEADRYLLPDVCLSGGKFLDGTSPDDLPRPVEVVPTDGISLTRSGVPMSVQKPVVAVVGRPNVGKSTLVNRIVGRREAIVEERPGVTRDRKTVEADWLGRDFTLVDTGGWLASKDSLDSKVSDQSERALLDADVAVLVVDGSVGLTDEDARVANLLRRREGPVLVAVNKIDDASHEPAIWEFVGLGLGDPKPVSALHGDGAGDLLDEIIALFPTEDADDSEVPAATDDEEEDAIAVAIVGRPNVGKSTLFNRLVGDERSVVHDMPGTTRDSVDTLIETELGEMRLVDTAGMRRRSRINEQTEYYSMVRALRSIDRADVALLVIDATEGVTHQDQRLAERVDGAGCPIVVLLNKWELLDAEAREDVLYQMSRRLHFLGEAPVLQVSALTGKGVHRLMPVLAESIDGYQTRIPTADLNQALRAAQAAQAAPGGARVLYATQGATDPPTFTLFANRTLPQTYLRYLERSLRDAFDLGGTPMKIRVRRRDD